MKDPQVSAWSRLADDIFSEHARWVGIIVANWTVLEAEMETVYAFILEMDYHRSKIAFYAVQNLWAKRDIITATIERDYKGTEISKRWHDLQADIRKAAKMRNRVAHAIWAEHPRFKRSLQLRATHVSGVYSQERKRYSVNNLKQNADFISRTAGAVNQLAVAIHTSQPTSPEISP